MLLELVRLIARDDDVIAVEAGLDKELGEEIGEELIIELGCEMDDDTMDDGGEAVVEEAGVEDAIELDEIDEVGSPEIE